MNIIVKDNIRTLIADIGYLIHNTQTDSYSQKVYTGINSDLSIFEEVIDDTVSEALRIGLENMKIDNKTMSENIKEVQVKNQSLHKIGKIVANNVTDDVQALEIKEFYDEWQEGVQYELGRYVMYKDVLYKVITAHTSQADWTPVAATSLFANVLTSLDGTPKDWVQPDSTNPYMKGDKVLFEGKTYESIIDNNIWSPSAYPAGWKEI